jgi:hypothetical protein
VSLAGGRTGLLPLRLEVVLGRLPEEVGLEVVLEVNESLNTTGSVMDVTR